MLPTVWKHNVESRKACAHALFLLRFSTVVRWYCATKASTATASRDCFVNSLKTCRSGRLLRGENGRHQMAASDTRSEHPVHETNGGALQAMVLSAKQLARCRGLYCDVRC